MGSVHSKAALEKSSANKVKSRLSKILCDHSGIQLGSPLPLANV
jgi:hypothetical protein